MIITQFYYEHQNFVKKIEDYTKEKNIKILNYEIFFI